MKSVKFILTSLLLLLLCGAKANVISGNIAWECQGNYQYRFIVDLYVDTTLGTQTLTKEKLQVKTICGTTSLSLKQYSIKNMAPTCDTLLSACSGNNCYKKIRLVAVRDLSDDVNNGCCEFELAFQTYVRSQKITTGAASLGFYIEAILNTCNVACHSSPDWEREGLIVNSLSNENYELGAVPNHKNAEFEYKLVTPMSRAGTQVFWSNNRSHTSPVPNTRFALDTKSGVLELRPSGSSKSIMAYNTVLKRNSRYLGEITREVLLDFESTGNSLPISTAQYQPVVNLNSNLAMVCGGEQACYNVSVYDADTMDTISVALIESPAYMNFSVSYPKPHNAIASYCFQPDSNVRPGFDTFRLRSKDNFCAPNLPQEHLYRIHVRDRQHFEPVITASKSLNCEVHTFSLRKKNTNRIDDDIQWYVNGVEVPNTNDSLLGYSDSMVYNFVKNGSYTVKAVVHSCPRKEVQYAVSVSGLNEISILNTKDTTACLSPFTMKLRATGGVQPYTYSAPGAKNASFVQSDPSVLFLNTYSDLTRDSAVYRVIDANGCYADQEIKVDFQAATESRIDLGQICGPVDSILNFPKKTGGAWYSESALNQQSVNLKDLDFGNHYWYYSNNDLQVCEKARLSFYIDEKPKADILDASFAKCKTSNFSKQLTATPAGGIWSGGTVSSNGFVDVGRFDEGRHAIVYTTEASNGCKASDTLWLSVENYTPALVMPGGLEFCNGSEDSFELVALPKGGQWKGAGVPTADGIKGKVAQMSAINNVYTYSYTDSLGCKASAKSIVRLNPLPKINFDVRSGIVNMGDSIEVKNRSSDSAYIFQWFIDGKLVSASGARTFNILPSDTGLFDFKCVAADIQSNCSDSTGRRIYHDIINSIAPVVCKGLRVYPNPASGMLYMEGVPVEAQRISVHGMDGKEIMLADRKAVQSIDISELPQGMYYLQVQTDGQLLNTLFVKQ